ncbi:Glu/Leu/Phe/Val dehydrogenase [Candidatus Woesearchaeota archaeon]|nr:Glu/Leu/Phe/Val dehydrogenase [Candidatus Woesearchaeota archaeon]
MVKYDEFGPEKILSVYDPKTGMNGFVVIDNTALGPAKGGIRMTIDVRVDECVKLARVMTWKCAITELPFGGGKSGIVADTHKIDDAKKQELIAAFAAALKPICPSLYVAAPDIGTAEKEMETFAKSNGSHKSCTGKPKNVCEGAACGIPHELGSTGWGVYHATLVALEHQKRDVKGVTFAVDGFGNVGSFAAKYLTEKGAKLVAVSDSKGCIYNSDGISFKELSAVKKKTGSVINYKPGNVLKSSDAPTVACYVFIPAAKADVIHAKNWKDVKAKLIVEGANIPIMHDIEVKLHKNGVLVIPDFVANAGGVISSYVEYIGGSEDDVFPLIEKKIVRNTQLVLDTMTKKNIPPRDAAMQIAIERVKKAEKSNNRR